VLTTVLAHYIFRLGIMRLVHLGSCSLYCFLRYLGFLICAVVFVELTASGG
jgi:hypothetical protein